MSLKSLRNGVQSSRPDSNKLFPNNSRPPEVLLSRSICYLPPPPILVVGNDYRFSSRNDSPSGVLRKVFASLKIKNNIRLDHTNTICTIEKNEAITYCRHGA